MKTLGRIFDFLASLELAVFLILTLAVILSVGTIYESKYSAAVASQLVYRSWWMQVLLWLFVCNLAAVALSRLPWRRHHIGFLITHLGIIILLVGSWVQQRAGVDGILALAPGESGRLVRLEENVFYVFRTVAGKAYDLVLEEKLALDQRRPLEKPMVYPLREDGGRSLKILQYFPKAMRKVKAEDASGGVPAIKFRLLGSRANFDDWIFLQPDVGSTREIGPARVRFLAAKPNLKSPPDKATLLFYLEGKAGLPPKMAVARSNQPYQELGRVQVGKNLPLGWMDFALVVDEYHAAAIPRAEYSPVQNAPANAALPQVIEAELEGQKVWIELGSAAQIPVGDALYYLQFTQRQVDVGFDLLLKSFKVDYYEGTNRPREYSSQVEVGGVPHTISMNEPLHHGGFTFYQSSYEADDDGTPRLSVFSVNYDPGRTTKYAGSLMLVLGIISMFYFKPIYSGNSKWFKK